MSIAPASWSSHPQFDLADPFSSDGLALVGTTETLGYVKKDGKYAIQPIYTGAGWIWRPTGPGPCKLTGGVISIRKGALVIMSAVR